MEENKKKKLFMIGMSVLLILIVVIGGTYAWFTLQLNGTKVNVLKAGTLSLILNDENSVGINSEKAVPMLDEVGETLDPYHFTLENHSDIASEYTIYLDDIDLETDEVRMSDAFVKYQLIKDGTKTTAKLNTIGENPNRILDSGTIDGNKTITYDLRLWIDENTGNEAMGQVVRTKIRVVATQSQQIATSEPRNENILNIYRYDVTACVTGEEATCVEIKQAPATYEAGTIIKYKVNDTEVKYFHVMFDEGDTLTLQQTENTINSTFWYETVEDNSKGPLTVLPVLENATKGWTNVNNQTYTMGTTPFQEIIFTGCYIDDTTKEITCGVNTYTLEERVGKARMITAQEAGKLGCTGNSESCPVWMIKGLSVSIIIEEGGVPEPTGEDSGYWTMSADSSNSTNAIFVNSNSRMFPDGHTIYDGRIESYEAANTIGLGARAVVVINKQ